MIDFDILKAYGSTNARLKEIFTALPDDEAAKRRPNETKEDRKARLDRGRQLKHDLEVRATFEAEFMNRIQSGMMNSLKHWRLYAAADMAWDSSPLTKTSLPLMMFAQGKIQMERCVTLLKGTKAGQQCIKKNDKGEDYVDVPRFVETQVNMVRSFVSRRHAAQKNKFNNLWPYYKYESRSTGLAGKLRADVLSQRIDIMADQFDYRHHDSQVIRDAMLYGHSVDFPRCSWEVEKQYRRKDGGRDFDAYVAREGLAWFNPHPSRLFWDDAYPLASINSDSGCEHIGFWDVSKFSDIEDNPAYFNKNAIGFSNRYWGDNGVVKSYTDYFTNYSYTLMPPYKGEVDPSAGNDRKNTQGLYAGAIRDSSIFVTNYFRRLVPKDYGIGNYPASAWVRFVIASDNTVVFAEFMPSSPAAYLGINENDSRQCSVSTAMDIMPYQDQMTNLLTQLSLLCQAEVFKVFGLNKDLLTDAQVKYVQEQLAGQNWSSKPLVIEYSMSQLLASGVKPPDSISNPLTVSEARMGQSITVIFEAMAKLVSLAERMLALSPAEQGQPAPREISATEVSEIANTTSSIYSSISDDIDEWRSAKKRILYESLVSCGQTEVICPVKDRYTVKTIQMAGFKAKQSEDEDFSSDLKRRTVIGSKHYLVHDYIFTSRDGAERPVNTQAANTLVQLVAQLLAVPTLAQALGKEKLYELFNEIFRLSGCGVDLNLQLAEGEDNSLGGDQIAEMKGTIDQISQYLNQMAGQMQKNAADLQSQEQMNQQQEQAIKGLLELAKRVQTMAGDVSDLRGRHEEINKRLTEMINYKDAPESIRRQMEAQAGFQPASQDETEPSITNGN